MEFQGGESSMQGTKPLFSLIVLALLLTSISAVPPSFSIATSKISAPEPTREFRGAWVATVANIDWPSKPGLSTPEQQTELIAILDRSVQLHLNAVVLQVRPACDALYNSKLEPWSEYITGVMGQPPAPYYDPLEFAVAEAHKRGIELHAWFNPYRAHHPIAKSPISSDHISKTKPYLVRQYGAAMWLDPGEKEVQDYSIRVVLDVVKRYDIDGVHIDDYFYPYKEKGPDGRILEFPDDHSYIDYIKAKSLEKRKKSKVMNRDDWRRSNVNTFVERLNREIHKEKSWVKFGVSPFGIWRPGNPKTIKGFDSYAEIYSDSKLWLNQGWMDYCSPQLYWRSNQANLSYRDLLSWWSSQNTKNRHLWPGNYTSQTTEPDKPWPASEITHQIDLTREQTGATGNLHFSMQALMAENSNLSKQLQHDAYAQMTLVPASPWLKKERLEKPKLHLQKDPVTGDPILQWNSEGHGKVWLWALQMQTADEWETVILPSLQSARTLKSIRRSAIPSLVSIRGVDRCGNLGPQETVEIRNEESVFKAVDTKTDARKQEETAKNSNSIQSDAIKSASAKTLPVTKTGSAPPALPKPPAKVKLR